MTSPFQSERSQNLILASGLVSLLALGLLLLINQATTAATVVALILIVVSGVSVTRVMHAGVQRTERFLILALSTLIALEVLIGGFLLLAIGPQAIGWIAGMMAFLTLIGGVSALSLFWVAKKKFDIFP